MLKINHPPIPPEMQDLLERERLFVNAKIKIDSFVIEAEYYLKFFPNDEDVKLHLDELKRYQSEYEKYMSDSFEED